VEKKTSHYVVAGTAAALGLLMGSSAVVSHRADYAEARLSRRANELRQRHEALPMHQDAPWGTTVEGNAFVSYDRAGRAAEAFGQEPMVALLQKDDGELAAEHELRAQFRPIAEDVRRGAHARDRRMIRPERRPDKLASLMTYRAAANAAIFEARYQRAAGNDLEAVRYTLDAMTFGADCVHDGVLIHQMIGAALVAIGVEAWDAQQLAQLDGEALAEFADGLAQLDRRLPDELRLEHEMTVMAGLVLDLPDASVLHDSLAWRYGFSTRWMTAEAFLMMADAMDRLNAQQHAAWADRKVAYEQEAARMLASGNDAAHVIMPNLVAAETQLRQVKAMVRLLRLAVDMHRGVESHMADPLGDGDLMVVRDGNGAELRSVAHEEVSHLARRVELDD
jgi:hypothetical protein